MVSTALFAVLGCARIGTTTTVHADGSFVRTVVYRGSAPNSEGFSLIPALNELVVPPRGPGWTVTQTKETKPEDELVITASKPCAVGETLSDDLAIRAPGKKDETPASSPPVVVMGNTVTVRRLPNGQVEYREVIRWRGARPKELATPEPELVAALRTLLPPALASDRVTLGATALQLQKALWQALFGPGDPLLGLLVSHPELAEFKLKKRLGQAAIATLETTFGEKLSAEARRTAANAIVTSITDRVSQQAKQQKEAGPAASSNNNEPLVALLLKAKLPGKLVSTNGEQDPVTGEVVWGMFSQAPAAGDITLTALCEPGG